MQIGMSVIACSFFYLVLLAIVYFNKRKVNTFETRLYGILLGLNIIGLFLEFICCLTVRNLELIPFINMIFNRLYLVYFVTYITIFTVYVYYVSFDKQKINTTDSIDTKNKMRVTISVIYAISLFCVLFLPLYYYNDKNSVYSYGPATNFLTILCGIYMIIDLYCMLKNFQNIKTKKNIPLFALLIFFVIAFIVRNVDPSIILINSSFALVTAIMYFTIENPDIKMIEQLNIARDQAEKANHAKSDFLSSMSHEIRTPLNAIVGFSQALTEEDLPPQAKDEVKDIMMASETLLEIVNGILDISKIEANKLEIVNTEYNFNLILEELVSLTKARLGEKPLEFKYKFDPSIPPYLYGDKVRVKQIILNLLTNAVKYTKEGWISFEVNAIQKEGVCRLIISVEDSGIGIKPESIDKLFTKFERLDIEKNNTIEGTGLGLAITKKLLDLMGGQVVVQSVYGQGSKFTVAIDQRIVTNPTTVVEPTQVPIENLDLSTMKILIVDDNKINLKVASRLLSDYHCQIETLESGLECIDKIKAGNTYNLILMDDMMPKLSGVETLHQLQQIPGFSIPTIALTANAISGMKEKYLQEGFHDYLAKPIDKKELYRVLTKFLVQK